MATHSSVLAWRRWAAVYGVTQSQTQLKRLSSSSSAIPGLHWDTIQLGGVIFFSPSQTYDSSPWINLNSHEKF